MEEDARQATRTHHRTCIKQTQMPLFGSRRSSSSNSVNNAAGGVTDSGSGRPQSPFGNVSNPFTKKFPTPSKLAGTSMSGSPASSHAQAYLSALAARDAASLTAKSRAYSDDKDSILCLVRLIVLRRKQHP